MERYPKDETDFKTIRCKTGDKPSVKADVFIRYKGDGGIEISSSDLGWREEKVYYYYTKREAIAEYRKHYAEEYYKQKS